MGDQLPGRPPDLDLRIGGSNKIISLAVIGSVAALAWVVVGIGAAGLFTSLADVSPGARVIQLAIALPIAAGATLAVIRVRRRGVVVFGSQVWQCLGVVRPKVRLIVDLAQVESARVTTTGGQYKTVFLDFDLTNGTSSRLSNLSELGRDDQRAFDALLRNHTTVSGVWWLGGKTFLYDDAS